ncbi:MAG: type II secretion system F family protein [Armatimonadota bacterium]
MVFLVAILTFTVTALLVVVISMVVAERNSNVSSRLRDISANDRPAAQQTESTIRSDTLPTLTKILSGRQLAEKLYLELSAAGLIIKPSEFIGIILFLIVILSAFTMLFTKNPLIYVAVIIISLSIPMLALRYMQIKRRNAFNDQIADTLTMMSSSLKAGFSLLRSMQIVANEMSQPIAGEFQRVIDEINVGKPLIDALKSSVSRMRSYDYDLAVTAINIQHQVGGNLSEILETIASTIRERMRIMGEMRSLTAEGKLSGVILIMLPIFMVLILNFLHPTYMIVLVKERIGHYLIAAGIMLQVIGSLIINKMLTIDI